MKTLAVATFVFLVAPAVCLAQKIPVAVDHEGEDAVGKAVALALKETIRNSARFALVERGVKSPRIIVISESTDALTDPQKGRVSAIAFSIIYYRTNGPGVGIFLGIAVQSCRPNIIEVCASRVLPYVERAVDFLQRHDPELWKTL